MLSLSVVSGQAVYIVNSNNDMDDGTCDAMHCSLREAIKASEADGKYSIINFNIGPGTQVIVPAGPLPVINADSTDIGIPAGNPNKVTINFQLSRFRWRFIPADQWQPYQYLRTGVHQYALQQQQWSYHQARVQPIVSALQYLEMHSTMITLPYRAQIANLSMWHNPIRWELTPIILDWPGYFQAYRLTTIGSDSCLSLWWTEKFQYSQQLFCNAQRQYHVAQEEQVWSMVIFGAYDTSKSPNFLDPDTPCCWAVAPITPSVIIFLWSIQSVVLK